MSDGSRSGVNWIRDSCASRFLARLLIARVLARPGSPSTSRLPLAQEAEQQALDHRLLADDRLADFRLQREDVVAPLCGAGWPSGAGTLSAWNHSLSLTPLRANEPRVVGIARCIPHDARQSRAYCARSPT